MDRYKYRYRSRIVRVRLRAWLAEAMTDMHEGHEIYKSAARTRMRRDRHTGLRAAHFLDVDLVRQEHRHSVDPHSPPARRRQPVLERHTERLVCRHPLVVAFCAGARLRPDHPKSSTKRSPSPAYHWSPAAWLRIALARCGRSQHTPIKAARSQQRRVPADRRRRWRWWLCRACSARSSLVLGTGTAA